MKISLRTLFSLLLLCGAALMASAQAPTLSLRNIAGSGNTWHYGTVACTSPRPITSITLSMINNEVGSIGNRTGAGINPATNGIFTSLGNNPRTVIYVFNGISTSDAANFIGGIDFARNNTAVPGANPYVRISVDANPTKLPVGATITIWKDHPDGSPHYYVWVASPAIYWNTAYNDAKSYYFQGMRGYLATITSDEENRVLTNISKQEGWSAGVRVPEAITDGTTFGVPTLSLAATDFRWACGPETGFVYYTGVTYTDPGAGVANNAYNSWFELGPNNYTGYPYVGENCMQVNYSTRSKWNDYTNSESAIRGYFIEFGGSGEPYSVNGANYPANPAYKKPTIITNNAQWHNFSPGNTSVAGSTLKANPMRSNAMVIE